MGVIIDSYNINIENEKSAILEYLKDHWEIHTYKNTDLPETVDFIVREGTKYGISKQEEEISLHIDIYNSLVEKLKPEGFELKEIPENKDNEEIREKKYFETLSKVKTEFISSAQPDGYKEFKKKYEPDDFAESEIIFPFKGTNHHVLGKLQFNETLQPCRVYYNEIKQERTVKETLMNAIYYQGIALGQIAVTEKLGSINEIEKDIREILD